MNSAGYLANIRGLANNGGWVVMIVLMQRIYTEASMRQTRMHKKAFIPRGIRERLG